MSSRIRTGTEDVAAGLPLSHNHAHVASGFVIDERAVPERREGGAATRVTIDASAGSPRLEQRVVRLASSRSSRRAPDGKHELLYVLSGRGTLELGGERHALEPGTGAYVLAGEEYDLATDGSGELAVVSVTVPAENHDVRTGVTVRYADRPALGAGKDREFRYLVNQDLGCRDVTQFVGTIPPGRAPTHSHVYDEVVYVLEGEGVLHIGGRSTPIGVGSCIHLPPLEAHSLENVGTTPMRVLGVFHPSGDPASRAYDEER
jgi:mannose-6-phosphate isomerase-like protein (cupin superfamily)